MKNNMMILIVSTLFMLKAHAGNEVGNGGVGFWCEKEKTYRLLDFYEYELLNPPSKIVANTAETPEAILNARLNILKKFDAKNAELYLGKAKKLFIKMNFLDGIDLSKTNDSLEVAKPKGCQLKQFALQKRRESDHSVDFYFDRNIWDKLTPVTQAGLALHEIIYEHFSYLDEKNSIKVRKFTALIFSADFEKMSPENYSKFIKDLKLPLY